MAYLLTNTSTCDCWTMPTIQFGENVKIDSKKYCRLYTEEKQKILKKLTPKFEYCKTLYTKCDFKLEACVHATVLELEHELHEHHTLLESEMKKQRQLIDRMWELSQRYLLLTNSGICIKPYPEIVSAPAEQRFLCEFHGKLKELNNSKARLTHSLIKIQSTLSKLQQQHAQLDRTVDSVYIKGNTHIRPLAYVREIIGDLFKYFKEQVGKLNSWAQLIDPGDAIAIQDYQALIHPTDDIEVHLMTLESDCKCFRWKKRDWLKSHVRC